jgi:hypothetical protein
MALAALFLGERLTVWKIAAGLLGFAGILIIVQPGAQPISIGMVAAATAAVFFASTAILTKRLTRTESITCIMFWLTAMQLVIGLIACLYDGDMALPSAAMLPWLVVIGLGGLTAHFCLTTALSIAPACHRRHRHAVLRRGAAMGCGRRRRAHLRGQLPQHPHQPAPPPLTAGHAKVCCKFDTKLLPKSGTAPSDAAEELTVSKGFPPY